MRIALDAYRKLSLTQEELCVAAALFGKSCLYGVSDLWIRHGEKPLHQRVMDIERSLEAAGWILPEFDGTVHMARDLHELLSQMLEANTIARVRYESEAGAGRFYFYRTDRLAFMELDTRGRCHLGWIPPGADLAGALKNIPKADPGHRAARSQQWDLFDQPMDAWLSALVFEKQEYFYETIQDVAWIETEEKDLKTLWRQTADLLQRV